MPTRTPNRNLMVCLLDSCRSILSESAVRRACPCSQPLEANGGVVVGLAGVRVENSREDQGRALGPVDLQVPLPDSGELRLSVEFSRLRDEAQPIAFPNAEREGVGLRDEDVLS